jgi:hypothetical protein
LILKSTNSGEILHHFQFSTAITPTGFMILFFSISPLMMQYLLCWRMFTFQIKDGGLNFNPIGGW